MEGCEQVQAAVMALQEILGDALLAVSLHGSAVSEGLRPYSDIDLLAIVDCSMTDGQRRDLLAALLMLSGRYPATPGSPRCLELIVFRRADLFSASYPARAEFVYGEWLRDAFEAGELPAPACDPEYTLLLAQARQQAVSLFGPSLSVFLPEVPFKHVLRAMGDAIPMLMDGLRGDERNVLLTLARMWCTASTGEFVTKDAAAAWAISKVPEMDAAMLDYACRAYLGGVADEWEGRFGEVQRLAESLRARIIALL
ncbi:aminoglycoside adenylyltransferase family protein [Paracandidimonas soli]|uniref:Aminoglycoside (3'') (9) adenylyltransferase n=1 Tax=Paracandidimonas soli TaxID=1917182 RepID=A0A4R3VGR8_9BURK|nr:aminoglycoside adenylyltransferase family protein [Paracandidimonas soli]TCV03012.1 streptomycin 3'-adenylyltransferase [Paracandidimonas soli]